MSFSDSVDTEQNSSNNDLLAFHHVINSIYPKQVSKKVRQVKRAGAQQGKFMNSQAPYGYMKSPQDKHILIIDEDAATIENSLHWVLDVAFNEDKCRMRKDNSGENFAVIRHIAVNLLKQDKSKLSLKAKRHKCAYSDNFLFKILFESIGG